MEAGISDAWPIELRLSISVCHFPPGTSKWNKVEHRLFSFISTNWRGEPLRDYETIVRLIADTTTAKGLHVTLHGWIAASTRSGARCHDERNGRVNIKKEQVSWRMELHHSTHVTIIVKRLFRVSS